jgi:hypothetical protein
MGEKEKTRIYKKCIETCFKRKRNKNKTKGGGGGSSLISEVVDRHRCWCNCTLYLEADDRSRGGKAWALGGVAQRHCTRTEQIQR